MRVDGVSPGKGAAPSPAKKHERAGQPVSFEEMLSAEFRKVGGLKLSAHAERRLVERNLALRPEDMSKIEGAVQRAANKGARESLVIYGDLALVASVKNRTIITALEGKDMTEHIFTNIDSAVIIR